MIGAMPAVAVRHERQKHQKRSKWASDFALPLPTHPLTLSGLTMIGAMPAVAVRHERRKQERRHKRPSQLGLGLGQGLQSPPGLGVGSTGTSDSLAGDTSSPPPLGDPLPLQSPPHRGYQRQEFYVCGKVSVLHVVVVSLLLGAILVIVGLVQLTPGADASQHRYLLLGAGGALLLLGVLLAGVRCCCGAVLHWRARRQPQGTRNMGNEASGSVRETQAFRSRTNSTTNGQVNRVSSLGARGSLCSPTGNQQRRRSILEAERGDTSWTNGNGNGGGGCGACSGGGGDDSEQDSAERDNQLNEMSAAVVVVRHPVPASPTVTASTPSPSPAAQAIGADT